MRHTTAATGKTGELLAAAYLCARGYAIRARNVRLGRDEIDIVAHDPADDVVVFAEVKARSRAHADYRPELNLTPRKRAAMARAARAWMLRGGAGRGYRLDLLCVQDGAVTAHHRELSWPDAEDGAQG